MYFRSMDIDKTEEIIDFHGVYLLHSKNPAARFANIYSGYSNDPFARLTRHNKGDQFGGAKRTSNKGYHKFDKLYIIICNWLYSKGPWKLVLVVHNFPNDTTALQFEWALQNPKVDINRFLY